MDKKRKIINIAFLAIIMAVLLTGLIRTFVGAEDILEYENRKAERIKSFSFSSYADGSFQDSVESALSDQVEFASAAKQGYNNVRSSFIQFALKPFANLEYEEDDTGELVIDDNSDIGGSASEAQGTADSEEVNAEINNNNDEQSAAEPVTPAAVDAEIVSGAAVAVENVSGAAVEIGTADGSADVETTSGAAVLAETTSGPASQIAEKPAFDPESLEKGEAAGGHYQNVGDGLYIYGDYVLQGMASFKANSPRLDKFAAAFNKHVADHPELNFYSYYIERDSDQNYANGKRNGLSDYLVTILDLPESHMDRQHITDFETYKWYNMKSDHHWSYRGSYEGYKDIISMMKPGISPREPLAELKVGYTKGSFTKNSVTANFKDDFYVYEFDMPEFTITIGGKESKLGRDADWINKAKEGNDSSKVLYADYYGGDIGEIILHNPEGEGSLLMFGNSYDNAVIKLLASHYEYTYSIDLRYYSKVTGKNFVFDNYVSDHPVDDVLVMGNAYYYMQSPFIIN